MTSPSAPKDKFFKNVINPYLAKVLQHPQTVEMREGLLHIRYVEGPRRTGRVETRLEAMEQQVFKCQGIVEPGLDSNSIYSCSGRKKLERKFHHVLRHEAAAKP